MLETGAYPLELGRESYETLEGWVDLNGIELIDELGEGLSCLVLFNAEKVTMS